MCLSTGWLIDVAIVIRRLVIHCHLKLEQSQTKMIKAQPSPDDRTMCLLQVIKEQEKSEVVYKTLHFLYCGNKSVQNSSSSEIECCLC